jgi:hypothetical protein
MKRILLGIAALSNVIGGEMISVRKSEERGTANHGWLTTHHTFSFSSYFDPKFMGFRTLRVINEDIVSAKKGFDTHPHSDMEILTYILDGSLEHKDTMGTHSQIRKGDFQLMTAGTGIEHSEFNPSKDKSVHLLQIWIQPEKKGLKPEYQQKSFADHESGLLLVVSSDGREGSLKIHQNARIYLGRFQSGEAADWSLETGRHAWIQMIHGQVDINGVALTAGDGASITGEKGIRFASNESSEFLLFDLN